MDQMVFSDDAADAVNSIAGGTSPFSFFLYYTEPSLPDVASKERGKRALFVSREPRKRNATQRKRFPFDSVSWNPPHLGSGRPRENKTLDPFTSIPDLDKSNEKAKGVNINAKERK